MVDNELEEIESICDSCGKGKKRLSLVNERGLLIQQRVTNARAYRIREIHRRSLWRFETSSNQFGQSKCLSSSIPLIFPRAQPGTQAA